MQETGSWEREGNIGRTKIRIGVFRSLMCFLLSRFRAPCILSGQKGLQR